MKTWQSMLLNRTVQGAIADRSRNAIALIWRFLSGLVFLRGEVLGRERANQIFRLSIALVLIMSLTGCGGEKAVSQPPNLGLPKKTQLPAQLSGKLAEVAPPEVIRELNRFLDIYRPQVQIVSPINDEVVQTDNITVGLQVKDLPIFQDKKYGLGPHLNVILDNQPYATIYDLQKPLRLTDLPPGTHTLRVIAEKPWYESFKNDGAYAQATFHVFTKTDENNPQADLPLLTFNHPDGDYGAEPILIDFYLTNTPLQVGGNTNQKGGISDWRIRCTVNGDKFILDRWQSVYLKGFQKGKNWIQLEFLDDQGEPIKNVFNTTTRTINYEPKAKDILSKLMRNELKVEQVRGIVDVTYNPPEPVITPEPEVIPQPVITPTPKVTPAPKLEITPEPVITPTAKPEIKPTPKPTPVVKPTKLPTPQLETKPIPVPVITPTPEVTNTPQTEATPKLVTPEAEKLKTPKIGDFLNRFQKQKPNISPTQETTEVSPTPQLETTSEPVITPTPEATDTPETEATPELVTPEAEKLKTPKIGDFLNRFQKQKPNISPTQETTEVAPTPQLETTSEPVITPTPETTNTPVPAEPEKSKTPKMGDFLNRFQNRMPKITPPSDGENGSGNSSQMEVEKEMRSPIPQPAISEPTNPSFEAQDSSAKTLDENPKVSPFKGYFQRLQSKPVETVQEISPEATPTNVIPTRIPSHDNTVDNSSESTNKLQENLSGVKESAIKMLDQIKGNSFLQNLQNQVKQEWGNPSQSSDDINDINGDVEIKQGNLISPE